MSIKTIEELNTMTLEDVVEYINEQADDFERDKHRNGFYDTWLEWLARNTYDEGVDCDCAEEEDGNCYHDYILDLDKHTVYINDRTLRVADAEIH